MFDAFYQHLIINKKVALPGLGTLTLSRKPAQLNFAQKAFTAPQWEIIFVKGDVVADKKIVALVSQMQGIDETEAIERVNKYVFDIKREFSVYKKLELPKLGFLTENNDGQFYLENEHRLYQYFPDIAAERVLRENGDKSIFEDNALALNIESVKNTNDAIFENKQSRNEWWIDAIILAILAIAAIGYYYFQNGSFG